MWQTVVDELNGSFSAVPPLVSAIRLAAALILGGIVGFEREARGKPAGLRTHMLVSMAAALFIIIGLQISALDFGKAGEMRIDPLRLIEAVTAGVAFLAAGIIFSSGGKVHNITTGASLWLAGAVGLACGSGQIPLAAMATGIVVLVLFALRSLKNFFQDE
ncbi:putative Mg2+ transporter-C (MgtC) family protein [Poseidonocella pacifica]|uniref:Protein MgtC n=1 Tax=Poseidonocella pacifica TaxID=871651 RepID=A0A1I0X5F0_9RHOB|nr:MgtC/SapB family protein [Poseidonocella pacifica]SFA96269.1 putative Mg2+ transporter-C (MgtC) family protein [Poseidonocella pacifica]